MRTGYVVWLVGIALLMGTWGHAEEEGGRARPSPIGDRTPLITPPVSDEAPATEEAQTPVETDRTPEERLEELERMVRWLKDAMDPNRLNNARWLEQRFRDLERQISGLEQQLRRMEQQLRTLETRR